MPSRALRGSGTGRPGKPLRPASAPAARRTSSNGATAAAAGAMAVAAAAAAAAAAVAAAAAAEAPARGAAPGQGPIGQGPVGYNSVGQGRTPPGRLDDFSELSGPAANTVPTPSLASLPQQLQRDNAYTSGNDYLLHLEVKEALGLAPAYATSVVMAPGSASREATTAFSSARPGIRPSVSAQVLHGAGVGSTAARRPASAPASGRSGQKTAKTPGASPGRASPSVGSAEPSMAGSGASGPTTKAAPGLRRSLSSEHSSKSYLKDYRGMQEAKAKAQKASAEHAISASLYKHLCHMSEANSLAEDLGLQTRFRPHKKEKPARASGRDEIVCRIYEDGVLTTELPLSFFERRFKSLQARWNQLVVTKADKQGSAAAKGGKSGSAQRSSSQAVVKKQEVQNAKASGGHETGGARPPTLLSQEEQDALQRQIKRVTLETLALADKMWQQLDGLEKDPKPLNPFVIH